jgi:urease accessory protein
VDALWLLADSRLPTGGHTHSGGIEAAVRRGLVRGPDDVAGWLAGRVPTAGLVSAAAAAAACALGETDWARWDAALAARTPVAALREVSRAQGRAMLRTVRAAWPHAPVAGLGPRPHQALVLGVATAAAGGSPRDAAGLAVHHLVGQVCSAAVRLLGLDPLALAGVHARALQDHAAVVDRAVRDGARAAAEDDPDLLPTATTPLPEVLAVLHARSEGALFAS